MAKKNAGDILTCDWNPIIGCERYSAACRNCWYLDGIFPWHQRMGLIPAEVKSSEATIFEKRMTAENLKLKGGIVGICQNGDLFWDKVTDEDIHRVFDLIEEVAPRKKKIPKYLFWTKRAERMASFINQRYPSGVPEYMALAVSVEDQKSADERLPHLLNINGFKVIAIEPMLDEITLVNFINDVDWVVLGSETGKNARPLDLNWARKIKYEVKTAGLPFFIKQLGSDHKDSVRLLDGTDWTEFPPGFNK
jgi:protein gp37